MPAGRPSGPLNVRKSNREPLRDSIFAIPAAGGGEAAAPPSRAARLRAGERRRAEPAGDPATAFDLAPARPAAAGILAPAPAREAVRAADPDAQASRIAPASQAIRRRPRAPPSRCARGRACSTVRPRPAQRARGCRRACGSGRTRNDRGSTGPPCPSRDACRRAVRSRRSRPLPGRPARDSVRLPRRSHDQSTARLAWRVPRRRLAGASLRAAITTLHRFPDASVDLHPRRS